MASIKTITFLPEIFRSDTNQKFLTATLDQFTSEPDFRRVAGYIGRHYAPNYQQGDTYISEPTPERQNYQLEPALTASDDQRNITFFASYPDLLQKIAYHGGLINNPSRLFAGTSYNFNSLVDLDKLTNFSHYLWIPNGPPEVAVSAIASNPVFDFTVTYDQTLGGYRFGSSRDVNPDLVLIRGERYTFTVNQTGHPFWIQTKPGLDFGSEALAQDRSILGLTNNGYPNGRLVFDVQSSTAQSRFIGAPLAATVDYATDAAYTDIDNHILGDLISKGTLDGANGDLNGRTMIFLQQRDGDAAWQAPGSFDSVPFDNSSDEFDYGATVASGDRYNVFTIVVSTQNVDQLVTLVPAQTVASGSRVRVSQGKTYAGVEFLKDLDGKWHEIPVISAPLNELFYQDGATPSFGGRIKIVESNAANIDVTTDILGRVNYTSPNGVAFTNGLVIRFDATVTPASYQHNLFVVEGVGSSIVLVPAGSFVVPESYAKSDRLATPDYMVVDRASRDLNAWSRANRWFHESLISLAAKYRNEPELLTTVGNYQRGTRPIIEFDPDIILFRHGTRAKAMVEVLDFTVTNAFKQVEGQQNYTIQLPNGNQRVLTDGMRIIFAADEDAEVRNKIYRVQLITTSQGSRLHLVSQNTTEMPTYSVSGTQILENQNYSFVPAITFSDPYPSIGATTATGTAVMTPTSVKSVGVNYGGLNFNKQTQPTVKIGTSYVRSATPSIKYRTHYSIEAVNVTTPGYNYKASDSLIISSPNAHEAVTALNVYSQTGFYTGTVAMASADSVTAATSTTLADIAAHLLDTNNNPQWQVVGKGFPGGALVTGVNIVNHTITVNQGVTVSTLNTDLNKVIFVNQNTSTSRAVVQSEVIASDIITVDSTDNISPGMYVSGGKTLLSISGIANGTLTKVATSVIHGLTDGEAIRISLVQSPGPTDLNTVFYVKVVDASTLALYNDAALTSAYDSTNSASWSSGNGGVIASRFIDFGVAGTKIKSVLSATQIQLTAAVTLAQSTTLVFAGRQATTVLHLNSTNGIASVWVTDPGVGYAQNSATFQLITASTTNVPAVLSLVYNNDVIEYISLTDPGSGYQITESVTASIVDSVEFTTASVTTHGSQTLTLDINSNASLRDINLGWRVYLILDDGTRGNFDRTPVLNATTGPNPGNYTTYNQYGLAFAPLTVTGIDLTNNSITLSGAVNSLDRDLQPIDLPAGSRIQLTCKEHWFTDNGQYNGAPVIGNKLGYLIISAATYTWAADNATYSQLKLNSVSGLQAGMYISDNGQTLGGDLRILSVDKFQEIIIVNQLITATNILLFARAEPVLTVTLNPTTVESITINDGGAQYTSAPLITVESSTAAVEKIITASGTSDITVASLTGLEVGQIVTSEFTDTGLGISTGGDVIRVLALKTVNNPAAPYLATVGLARYQTLSNTVTNSNQIRLNDLTGVQIGMFLDDSQGALQVIPTVTAIDVIAKTVTVSSTVNLPAGDVLRFYLPKAQGPFGQILATFTKSARVAAQVSSANLVNITTDATPDTYEAGDTVLVGAPNNLTQTANNGSEVYNQFYYTGTTWLPAQKKKAANQAPRFDAFDSNGYSAGDLTRYSGSNFTGTRIFGYGIGTGVKDTILGFPLKYRNINNQGDIVFTNDFITDTFEYLDQNVLTVLSVKNLRLRKTNSNGTSTSVNQWARVKENTKQYQVFSYDFDGKSSYFPVDILPAASNTVPNIRVHLDNGLITQGTDYNLIQLGNAFAVYVNPLILKTNSKVDVEIYSSVSSNTAHYELPVNYELNPLNSDFTSVTLGQMRRHLITMAENHSGLVGRSMGINNLRDLDYNHWQGAMLQHASPAAFASMFLVNKNADAVLGIEYAAREYTKFKNRFMDMATKLQLSMRDAAADVDTIMTAIMAGKTPRSPWFNSDMVAYGSTRTVTTLPIIDANRRRYEIPALFNNTVLGNRAVLVYLVDATARTKRQLIVNKDFVFETTIPAITLSSGLTTTYTQSLQIVDINTRANYVPETPTKLGLWPKFVPQKYTDNTYREPVDVIQGHDGSLTVAFGDFRDDLLLELETRIYNNIKVNYNTGTFDIYDHLPGKFRSTDYNRNEFNQLLTRRFLKWVGSNRIDYTLNDTFVANDPFTWNYSNLTDSVNGEALPGHWRAVFEYFYDTDRPHIAPWEMLGFSEKPDYWDSAYGAAPYTGGNTLMWNDIEAGRIISGARAGIDTRFARPGLSKIKPVDEYGQLLAPSQVMLASYDSTSTAASWQVGDQGPVETAWRRSSEFAFAVQVAIALGRPAYYLGTLMDTTRYQYNTDLDQYIETQNNRIGPSTITIPDDGVGSGTETFTSGYINWVKDYLTGLGINGTTYLQDLMQRVTVNLSYRMAGYSDQRYVTVYADQSSPGSSSPNVVIPDQNYRIALNKSTPVQRVVYSAVIVERSNLGWTVSGYDLGNPYFTIIPSQPTGNAYSLTVLNATATVYRDYQEFKATVPYGYEFTSIQDVVDFLISYQRYLIGQGFVFDQFSQDLGVKQDFALSSQEFMIWAQQGWNAGSLLVLSPVFNKIHFNNDLGVIDGISNSLSQSKVLDQNFNLIKSSQYSITRQDNDFTLTALFAQTIGLIDMDLVQYEHVIVFDNTTVFNDVIYQPEIGARQYRLKLTGAKTAGWTGALNPPGMVYNSTSIDLWQGNTDYRKGQLIKFKDKVYVAKETVPATPDFVFSHWDLVDQTKIKTGLLPNFATNADKGNTIYDVDNQSIDESFDAYSNGLIGFRERSYLTDFNLGITSQVKFYQGYIRQKGSKNAITALTKAKFGPANNTVNVYENWGIRVGEYGALGGDQYIELRLPDNQYVDNPSTVLLNGVNDTPTSGVINISPSEVYGYSDVAYNNNFIGTRPAAEQRISDLVTAGYVRFEDVDGTLFDITNLGTGANTVISANNSANASVTTLRSIGAGYKIWVAKDFNSSWNVYRITETNALVTNLAYSLDGTMTATCDTKHGLVAKDVISLTNFDPEFDGLYQVKAVLGNNSFAITLPSNPATVSRLRKNQSIDGTGILFLAKSVRLDNISQLVNFTPPHLWRNQDRVWVDNDQGTNQWGVYQKQDGWQFGNLAPLNGSDIRSSIEYGSVTRMNSDNTMILVGAPLNSSGSLGGLRILSPGSNYHVPVFTVSSPDNVSGSQAAVSTATPLNNIYKPGFQSLANAYLISGGTVGSASYTTSAPVVANTQVLAVASISGIAPADTVLWPNAQPVLDYFGSALTVAAAVSSNTSVIFNGAGLPALASGVTVNFRHALYDRPPSVNIIDANVVTLSSYTYDTVISHTTSQDHLIVPTNIMYLDSVASIANGDFVTGVINGRTYTVSDNLSIVAVDTLFKTATLSQNILYNTGATVVFKRTNATVFNIQDSVTSTTLAADAVANQQVIPLTSIAGISLGDFYEVPSAGVTRSQYNTVIGLWTNNNNVILSNPISTLSTTTSGSAINFIHNQVFPGYDTINQIFVTTLASEPLGNAAIKLTDPWHVAVGDVIETASVSRVANVTVTRAPTLANSMVLLSSPIYGTSGDSITFIHAQTALKLLAVSQDNPSLITLNNPLDSSFLGNSFIFSRGQGGNVQALLTPGSISTVDVISTNTLFSTAPQLQVLGGGGSGAVLQAQVVAGQLVGVTVIDGGRGYTYEPTIIVKSTNIGASAVVRARLTPGVINSLQIKVPGINYRYPRVVFTSGKTDQGNAAGASASVGTVTNGLAGNLSLSLVGQGYTSTPTITVVDSYTSTPAVPLGTGAVVEPIFPTGAVRAFSRASKSSDALLQINSIIPVNPDLRELGFSLDLGVSTAAVGAPGTFQNRGAVLISQTLTGEWNPLQILAVTGANTGSRFGHSVSMSKDENWLYVGAPGADSVYAYAKMTPRTRVEPITYVPGTFSYSLPYRDLLSERELRVVGSTGRVYVPTTEYLIDPVNAKIIFTATSNVLDTTLYVNRVRLASLISPSKTGDLWNRVYDLTSYPDNPDAILVAGSTGTIYIPGYDYEVLGLHQIRFLNENFIQEVVITVTILNSYYTLAQILTPGTSGRGSNFGRSVSANRKGYQLMVGAPYHTDVVTATARTSSVNGLQFVVDNISTTMVGYQLTGSHVSVNDNVFVTAIDPITQTITVAKPITALVGETVTLTSPYQIGRAYLYDRNYEKYVVGDVGGLINLQLSQAPLTTTQVQVDNTVLVRDVDYFLEGTSITFFSTVPYGSAIKVDINQFTLLQTFYPDLAVSQGFYGATVDVASDNLNIAIGMPGYRTPNYYNGRVYRYINQAQAYGTITSTRAPQSLGSAGTIRLNDQFLTFGGVDVGIGGQTTSTIAAVINRSPLVGLSAKASTTVVNPLANGWYPYANATPSSLSTVTTMAVDFAPDTTTTVVRANTTTKATQVLTSGIDYSFAYSNSAATWQVTLNSEKLEKYEILVVQSPITITLSSGAKSASLLPGNGYSPTELGLDIYALVQTLEHPESGLPEKYGSKVRFDDTGETLVVTSEGGATLKKTTFDLDLTTVDRGTTRFIDILKAAGAVLVYDYLPIPGATLNTPAEFLFNQVLQDANINFGDNFGADIDINNGWILVGAPGHEDTANGLVNTGLVHIFRNPDLIKAWSRLRTYNDKVDIDFVNDVMLYDSRDEVSLARVDYVDPAKGKILGLADQDIDFKTAYDPAAYNVVNRTDVNLDATGPWGSEQVGSVWWNLDACRYIDYEQGPIEYRSKYWGQLFPGSKVEVLEWVRSTVLPSEYTNTVKDGTPLYSDNSAYVRLTMLDNSTGLVMTYYYYWVMNKKSVGAKSTRNNSVITIARAIENPATSGQPFVAILATNAVNLYGFAPYLRSTNSVLRLEYAKVRNQHVRHTEYDLISEGDPNINVSDRLLSKIIDSLAGEDVYGNLVPDPYLIASNQIGIGIRPRQSIVRDQNAALRTFVAFINGFFIEHRVTDFNLAQFESAEPVPQSTFYQTTVANYASLSFVDTAKVYNGYRVLVANDETVENYWTIYQWNAALGIWHLERIQGYDTTRFWKYVDWYATGYNAKTNIDLFVPRYQEIQKLNLVAGQIIRAQTNSTGRWELYVVNGDLTTSLVGLENGTIQLKSNLYDSVTAQTGFDNGGFDSIGFSKSSTIELRNIASGLINDILIGDLAQYVSQVFFVMVNYVLSEQRLVDWIFKTSFLSVMHQRDQLYQLPSYVQDNQSYYESYIDEVKPYRSQVREYLLDYTKTDFAKAVITDFDLPAIYDKSVASYRVLDKNSNTDLALIRAGAGANWLGAYQLQIQSIEVVNGGFGYINPVAVFTSTTGSEATADVSIDTANGSVMSVSVSNPGMGYTTIPAVSIVNSLGNGFEALILMQADTVTVVNGGSLYQVGDIVTVGVGTGTAVLEVTQINSGAVTKLGITNPGQFNQVSTDTLSTTTSGIGSGLTVTMTFGVNSVTVVTGGTGYVTNPPRVVITGGGGSGASAHAVVRNGSVVSVFLDTRGSNYINTPTISFVGGGGSGARAYARMIQILGSVTNDTVNRTVRGIETTLRFDRTTYLTSVRRWKPFTTYHPGDIVVVADPVSTTFVNIPDQPLPRFDTAYRLNQTLLASEVLDPNLLTDKTLVTKLYGSDLDNALDRLAAYRRPGSPDLARLFVSTDTKLLTDANINSTITSVDNSWNQVRHSHALPTGHEYQWVAVGDRYSIATSTDGVNWIVNDFRDSAVNLRDAALYNSTTWIGVGNNGTTVVSNDGVNWTNTPLSRYRYSPSAIDVQGKLFNPANAAIDITGITTVGGSFGNYAMITGGHSLLLMNAFGNYNSSLGTLVSDWYSAPIANGNPDLQFLAIDSRDFGNVADVTGDVWDGVSKGISQVTSGEYVTPSAGTANVAFRNGLVAVGGVNGHIYFTSTQYLEDLTSTFLTSATTNYDNGKGQFNNYPWIPTIVPQSVTGNADGRSGEHISSIAIGPSPDIWVVAVGSGGTLLWNTVDMFIEQGPGTAGATLGQNVITQTVDPFAEWREFNADNFVAPLTKADVSREDFTGVTWDGEKFVAVSASNQIYWGYPGSAGTAFIDIAPQNAINEIVYSGVNDTGAGAISWFINGGSGTVSSIKIDLSSIGITNQLPSLGMQVHASHISAQNYSLPDSSYITDVQYNIVAGNIISLSNITVSFPSTAVVSQFGNGYTFTDRLDLQFGVQSVPGYQLVAGTKLTAYGPGNQAATMTVAQTPSRYDTRLYVSDYSTVGTNWRITGNNIPASARAKAIGKYANFTWQLAPGSKKSTTRGFNSVNVNTTLIKVDTAVLNDMPVGTIIDIYDLTGLKKQVVLTAEALAGSSLLSVADNTAISAGYVLGDVVLSSRTVTTSTGATQVQNTLGLPGGTKVVHSKQFVLASAVSHLEKDIADQIPGADYPGVRVTGEPFTANSAQTILDPDKLDTVITSRFTDSLLGQRPEDIVVDGGAFIDTYSSHAPEELVPGRVQDLLQLTVFDANVNTSTGVIDYGNVIAYKIFADQTNPAQYYRISNATTTVLASDLNYLDTQIHVADISKLPDPNPGANLPGSIFVNGEKIIYLGIDRANGLLLNIRRGAARTSIPLLHTAGSLISDASAGQIFGTDTVLTITQDFVANTARPGITGNTVTYQASVTNQVPQGRLFLDLFGV